MRISNDISDIVSRNSFWIFLHTLLIAVCLVSLLTGLRIALLTRDELEWLGALLPQGELLSVHILSATVFCLIIIAYTLMRVLKIASFGSRSRSAYHRWVIWLGYGLLLALAVTGLNRYFEFLPFLEQFSSHYITALLLILYLILHAAIYFIQYGVKAFKVIFVPSSNQSPVSWGLILVFIISVVVIINVSRPLLTRALPVTTIALDDFIRIDGLAREPQWESAKPVEIVTHGGANFNSGMTPVKVQALQNGEEIFFFIRWQDETQSLSHLPLKKTEQGWQVQGKGFAQDNETQFYEDKFAVMISDRCELPAAGTAHLGHKPLADKPANFHGKGYHFTTDQSIVDIWHWKAIRTDAMILADDNFFGPPVEPIAGQRRYKAGYLTDNKESGGYVMNWQWYHKSSVVPKRLPKQSNLLDEFQSSSTATHWLIDWFNYAPYKKENDYYDLGTLMPSVMYRSNRFEGDRADVRAKGIWHNGYWQLELVRRIDSNSENDVILDHNTCLWFSAFDHAQIAHTRHLIPLQLKLSD